MKCGCGEPADVVQFSTKDGHRYYYCLLCLEKIGVTLTRPFGWDGEKQQPKDEVSVGDWHCEFLKFEVLSSTPMFAHIERQRHNNP